MQVLCVMLWLMIRVLRVVKENQLQSGVEKFARVLIRLTFDFLCQRLKVREVSSVNDREVKSSLVCAAAPHRNWLTYFQMKPWSFRESQKLRNLLPYQEKCHHLIWVFITPRCSHWFLWIPFKPFFCEASLMVLCVTFVLKTFGSGEVVISSLSSTGKA